MGQEPRAGRLSIVGASGAEVLEFGHAELARLPANAQVADVGLVLPGKKGRAVWLDALLAGSRAAGEARFLNLASSDPNFAVSIALDELPRGALVVYELDGVPLPPEKGGPFRLLVPGHGDECVNVKQLARIELSRERGRDTRPADDAEHRKLHEQKGCGR